MSIEYVFYLSMTIVSVAGLSLVYAFIISMKKSLVHRAINKFSIYTSHPLTHQDLDSFTAYIEKNKKYLSDSAYKVGMYKVNKIRTLI